MTDRYVGIDPGDKWVGWATLIKEAKHYTASMGVINRGSERMFEDVQFIGDLLPTHLVVESYQQRPVGHNSFGRGSTLRFIGALQCMAEEYDMTWWEIAPGDAKKELSLLPIGRYIDKWMSFCPEPNNPQWRHAHSAWRVLAKALMIIESPVLTELAIPKRVPPMGVIGCVDTRYLRAPTATWIL